MSNSCVTENIERIQRVLEKERIQVPENFKKRCLSRATKKTKPNETKRFYRSLKDSDVYLAIKLAEYWKDTLRDKEDFDRLVVSAIVSLYGIQCFVVNNNIECKELYIGTYCNVDEEAPLAKGTKGRITCTYFAAGGKELVIK